MVSGTPAWSGALVTWVAALFLFGFCLCLVLCNLHSFVLALGTLTTRPTQSIHQKADGLCNTAQDYLIKQFETVIGVDNIPVKSHQSSSSTFKPASSIGVNKVHHDNPQQEILSTARLAASNQKPAIGIDSVSASQNTASNLDANLYTLQGKLPNAMNALFERVGTSAGMPSSPVNLHLHISGVPVPGQTVRLPQGDNTASAAPITPVTDTRTQQTPRRSTRIRKQTQKGIESSNQVKRYNRKKDGGI